MHNRVLISVILISLLAILFVTQGSSSFTETHPLLETKNKVADSQQQITQEPNNWGLEPGDSLIYNISYLDYNNTPILDVYDENDTVVGTLEENKSFIFEITELSTLVGEPAWVDGIIYGQTFEKDLYFDYTLPEINLNELLNTTEGGVPLLYFIIPIGSDEYWTNLTNNFTNEGFDVDNGQYEFSVGYANSSIAVNATWDKDTGALVAWYFNGTMDNETFETEFLLDEIFAPGWYEPFWGLNDPIMSYYFDQLEFENGSHELQLGESETSSGFFAEGQVAVVTLDLMSMDQGPSYHGDMYTSTGWTTLGSPFDEEPTDGPFIIFMFPISNDSAWWDVLEAYFAAQGFDTLNNATAFGIAIDDGNITTSMIWEKDTGVLLNWALNGTTDDEIPQNATMEMSLVTYSDRADWALSWGVKAGQAFDYLFKTLNFNGSKETEAEDGKFVEGQNLTVIIEDLSTLPDEVAMEGTFKSETGKSHFYIEILMLPFTTEGPPLFYPVIPKDSSNELFNFLEDMYLEMGYQVVNNATHFSVTGTDLLSPFEDDVTYNLSAMWEKDTGLLKYYRFQMYSTSTGEQIDIELVFLGEHIFPPESSTTVPPESGPESTSPTPELPVITPGFEILATLMAGIVITITYKKKRK